MDPARISLQDDRHGLTGLAFRFGNRATYLGRSDGDHAWSVSILIGPDDEIQTVDIDETGTKNSQILPSGEMFEALEVLAKDGPEAYSLTAALALTGVELRGADDQQAREFAALLRLAAADHEWSLPVRLAGATRELHLSDQGRGILRNLGEMLERDGRAMTTMPAARRLELSEAVLDAMHTRIRRQNLQAYRVHGRWYVVMDNLNTRPRRTASEQPVSDTTDDVQETGTELPPSAPSADVPVHDQFAEEREAVLAAMQPRGPQVDADRASAQTAPLQESTAGQIVEPVVDAPEELAEQPALTIPEASASMASMLDQESAGQVDASNSSHNAQHEAQVDQGEQVETAEPTQATAETQPEQPVMPTQFSDEELDAAARMMEGPPQQSQVSEPSELEPPLTSLDEPAEDQIQAPAADLQSPPVTPEVEAAWAEDASPEPATPETNDGMADETEVETTEAASPESSAEPEPDPEPADDTSGSGPASDPAQPASEQAVLPAPRGNGLLEHYEREITFLRGQLSEKDRQIEAWIQEGKRKDLTISRIESRMLGLPVADGAGEGGDALIWPSQARQQLDAARDEWLQPVVDQILSLENQVGRLESELTERQASTLAEIRQERDTLRSRVETLEAEVMELRTASNGHGHEHSRAVSTNPDAAMRRLPWYRRIFGSGSDGASS